MAVAEGGVGEALVAASARLLAACAGKRRRRGWARGCGCGGGSLGCAVVLVRVVAAVEPAVAAQVVWDAGAVPALELVLLAT